MQAESPLAEAHILLVEDDEAIREALCDVLSDCGHRLVCAENGARALDTLLSDPLPKLILLDLMMPVMDGWQLLQRLDTRPHWRAIPVVTVSAARAPTPRGACHSLRKPVDLEALLAAIERFCRPPQASQIPAPSPSGSACGDHSQTRAAPWQAPACASRAGTELSS